MYLIPYLIIIFCSGFASLVYEVLWMKQLGLLFGNTSHAAGATLAAFFAGMAVGSWLWGRHAAKVKNSLRTYAWLEVGVIVTALLYFLILNVYHALYPWLYQSIGSGWRLLGVKFILALALVFPPALFMGGTIPVIGQFLIRKHANFGKLAALLYGVNTLGAAFGAYMAGFHLPLWLGFRLTFLAAITVNTAVALAAFRLSRTVLSPSEETRQSLRPPPGKKKGKAAAEPAVATPPPEERLALLFVCFLSGFGFLALEVLWTRMFAQVLENSVYTFAAILVIVLLCLALGAFVSSWLARLRVSPLHMLAVLLLISGLCVALNPFVFMQLTNSLQIIALRDSWLNYILLIFKKGILTIGPPALLLGMIFPFLMKSEERYTVSPGRSLGHLAAMNTAGAILGALACGFLLLEFLGMWGTMQLLAALYLLAALLLPLGWQAKGIAIRVLAVLLLLAPFTFLNPRGLPVNSVDPLRHQNEEILETWEGSDCTVAVAKSTMGLSIKVNSHYGLGSTGAFRQETLQNDIPLMAYPRTESIFFLGLGTGITAGSALDARFEHVERIVACELVPEVITAAKKYMTDVDGRDYTNGLFEDPRATILAEDGRHYLMAAREKFDMVNGDLFVPFRTGVGSLYTKEHFQNIKDRLENDGVFFQWIPLYQVTENEFSIIARTMLEVFDDVSLWRTNFQPGRDVVALAGHKGGGGLPASELDSFAEKQQAVAGATVRDLGRLALPFNQKTIAFFYCGNVGASAKLFEEYPVNTDNRPVIEYMAPRSYRKETDSGVPWFIGPRLADLTEELQRRCPPASDPLLRNRSAANRQLPAAGNAYYRARLWQMMGRPRRAEESWDRFIKAWLQKDQAPQQENPAPPNE